MAGQTKDAGDFNLIIAGAESDRLEEATSAFAKAFSLDSVLAGQMIKAAPIIFASKLTKAEVKAITPKLTELSDLGLEFRLTARVAQKMPKVNWPVRPQFTAGGSGGPNGLAFHWDNNAFVCPSCGETFLFRRLGKLPLVEPPAESSSASSASRPAASKSPAPKAAGGRSMPSGQSLEDAAEALDIAPPDPIEMKDEVSVQGVEGVEPLPGEGESIDLAGDVEEIKLEDDPAPEAVAPEAPAEEPAEVQIEEATEEEEPAPAAEKDEGPPGERYNVFLSKITDRSRQDKVAELISKVKGCSMTEARDLTTRLVIPIAKSIPKEQAEDILNQFKKIKVFGRMTKVK